MRETTVAFYVPGAAREATTKMFRQLLVDRLGGERDSCDSTATMGGRGRRNGGRPPRRKIFVAPPDMGDTVDKTRRPAFFGGWGGGGLPAG